MKLAHFFNCASGGLLAGTLPDLPYLHKKCTPSALSRVLQKDNGNPIIGPLLKGVELQAPPLPPPHPSSSKKEITEVFTNMPSLCLPFISAVDCYVK